MRFEALIDRALLHIEVAPRISRMAELFGVRDALPEIERWRGDEMAAACAACPHRVECAALLRSADARADGAGFCPNLAHFRAIAAGYVTN